jgi:hypothetical protein
MTAPAKWLTSEDATQIRSNGMVTAQAIVAGAFPEWPESRCSALLAGAMQTWGKGPLVTAGILSRASTLILSAWRLREHIAGVMLLSEGDRYVPLYLHRLTLALRMQSPSALWVNFQQLKEAE